MSKKIKTIDKFAGEIRECFRKNGYDEMVDFSHGSLPLASEGRGVLFGDGKGKFYKFAIWDVSKNQ